MMELLPLGVCRRKLLHLNFWSMLEYFPLDSKKRHYAGSMKELIPLNHTGSMRELVPFNYVGSIKEVVLLNHAGSIKKSWYLLTML